jgi:hypothetical protein
MDVHFETGEIIELGETYSAGNFRHYTHLELRNAEGGRILLHQVLADVLTTPKLSIGQTGTLAFVNRSGYLPSRKHVQFKNAIVGFGNQTDVVVGQELKGDGNRNLLIGLAAVAVILLMMGHPFVAAMTLPFLVVFGNLYMKTARAKGIREQVEAQFAKLGYTQKISKVYA